MNNRPRILVVSYNIPRPDKSSGELRFVAILEILSGFWDLDFCVAPSHAGWNKSAEQIPYIQKLAEKGIRVLPVTEDAFSMAVQENQYAGGYFNLYWIAEAVMPLFKMAQPSAFTIVDSVDVHFAREETQAKLGAIDMSQVLQTKKRELGVYKSADVTIAVSKDDLHLLTVKEGLKNVFLIPNIVREYPRVGEKRKPVVVFIGCYAWYPNPEAVKWFADLIWPTIYKSIPRAEFLIIGSDPTPEVLALAEVPGIRVLGYVPETKPYLEIAAVSVAPLRVGGGMKGKVNEAMAHGIPVVATSIGAQGFEAIHGKHMMVADEPAEFAAYVIALLSDEKMQREMGLAGQQLNSAICSHQAVKEKIRELAEYCSGLIPQTPGRPFRHLLKSWSGKLSLFIKDIGYAVQLLQREGISEFFRRTLLYLKGQRLPVYNRMQKQGAIPEPDVVKTEGILEFPLFTEPPMVSVIIPVYNQWEYTFACLGSILKNSGEVSYEIIMVDDNSSDDTKIAGLLVKNIRIIRNESNLGFLFNCNKAAAQAKGKYIILLNNDTLVEPGWVTWFMKTMEESPKVGLVGAKLIFSTGKLQEAGGIVFKDGSAMNYGREDDPDRPQYNYFKDVDYCSGAAICVRKILWDQLNGFDPQYAPAYYEDTDLCMQIRAMGYRTVYQPKSVVIHFEGVSHGTDITRGIKKKQDDNQKIFYSKWREELYKNNYLRDENIFRARDKSKYKQTVLIIDHTLPNPSSLVGHKKSSHMINRYIESSFNIKFLPDDFLKQEPFATELEQQGCEILYGDHYKENWLLWIAENTGNIDSICFVDETLANKYLPKLKKILKHDFSYIIHDQTIEK
jgi:GT2 family glycosyltransferase/glycosyltransferase involved in cell wall biosynthesis